MPRATRHYRLRIRNAADSADDLVLTSVPGGTNPYLTGPPQGDGQQIDPAKGESSIGAYMIEAADVGEIVTAALVDGNGRQTLIQRRAYLELSTDGGSSFPTVLVPGFVNAYRLVTPMRWAFTIGESRRIEYTRKVWDRTTENFEQATCLIGGPIKDGWGPIVDYGGWEFVVTGSDADTVTLRFSSGFIPIDESNPLYQEGGRAESDLGALTQYARNRANQLAAAEESLTEIDPDTEAYQGIVVFVQSQNGSEVDRFTPRAQLVPGSLSRVLLTRGDEIKLLRAGTAWASSAPPPLTIFRLYAWRTTIGEDNPLHIESHPVDILTDLWDDAGMAYDSTEATATRGVIGDNTRLTLRITESWMLRDVQQMIGGLFGITTRVGTDGELELITARVSSIAAPSNLYDDDDLRSPDTVIFEVDEQSVYNTVTVEQLRFHRWAVGMGERPTDDVVALSRTRSVDLDSEGGGTPDSETFGVRELRFEVPGIVVIDVSGQSLGDDYFERALAAEVFDRFGRGGVYGTIAALPTITEKIGQEIRLDVSHLPNAGARGGVRILQVVRRTETPSGPILLLLDLGPNSQFATSATFSLAAGAADARKHVDVTITNAAALNTAGAWLRVEWAVAGSEPSSGSLLIQYMAGQIPSSFTTPAVDAGSHVWMRMQAFIPDNRATAYTAWQDVDLTDLTAPSSLSESAGSDPARITIEFTEGESDIPLEVFQRPQGDPANEARVVDRLSPGSDRVTLTLEPGSSYTIGIRYRELAPFFGLSSTTEISFTVAGSADTLPAPTQAFELGIKWSVGSIGGVLPDGATDQYAVGLRVRSAIDEGFIEFEMATETAVGSGTPGSYSLEETTSVTGVDETYIFTIGVPLDGKLRYLRARHVRVGADASSYTSVLSVMPGDIVSPAPSVDPLELTEVVPVTLGGTEIADPTSGVLLVGAGSSAMTQLAPGAAGGYARSSGSAWVRSSGVAAPDLTGTVASARLSGVYSSITGLGVQAQALDMGTFGITNVGTITASGIAIESGSPILTLKDTNNVLGDVAYSSYVRGTDSTGTQAWWLGDGQSGVKQASFWATTGYKLGLYSNDTLVLMLSDSSTLATFSGAVSMGALTATTGTFSGTCYIGDTSNANATLGLTINQGAADNHILVFKSSDVSTGLTTGTLWVNVEVDDYMTFQKRGATGGAVIQVVSAALHNSLVIDVLGGAPQTGTGTGANAAIMLRVAEHDGANGLNDMAANSNLLAIAQINSGGSDEVVWICKENGATWQNGGITATTGTFSSYLQGTTGNGYLDLRGDSGAASGLRIDDSGNVLIGTTTDAGFKLDVNGTGRVSGDFTIGSLGVFDSTSAPSTDFILRYNGSRWVSAYLHTQFFAGDGVSQINGDGTTSAFVYSNPSLSGAPSPNPSAAPVITASHKSIKIDMRAYTLGATETFVLDYSIDGGAYTTDAIISTGTQVVHATLTPGSTYAYKYKIRGGSDTPYSPASSATNPLNDSSAQAFGIVLAADVVATNLAAISADIGDIGAGQIRNAANTKGVLLSGSLPGGWTQYIDFVATGANPFIKHDNFELWADGTAIFNGQLDITSPGVSQPLQNMHMILREPTVTHGLTDLVETNTVGAFGSLSVSLGGLRIFGFSESGGSGLSLQIEGTTAKTSSTDGIIKLVSYIGTGTNRTNPAASDIILAIAAGTSNKVLVYGDGDITASGDITAVAATLSGGLSVSGEYINALDLADDLEVAERTIALSAGANNNLATGTVTVQRLQSTGGVANITGLAGGRAGRVVMLYNYGSNTVTLNHNNGGSSAANRMILPGNSNIALTQGSGATLVYDTATSLWRCAAAAV